MFKVIEVQSISETEWAALVKTSLMANWFQTPEAYRFFSSLSFFETFCWAVESDGCIKGIVAGYMPNDGGRLKQFFSRRAIITGGPLLADDISEEELTSLLGVLKDELKQKAIYIEIRNFNDYSRWRYVFESCGFEYEPHLNFQVKCPSKEKVWKNLKENRRRQIKKALSEGVVIEEASSEKEVMSYYQLLHDLYTKKVKKPLFPLEFFLEFYRKKCGKFLLVKDDDEIIGGIMCPILDNRTIYELFVCGNDVKFKNKYPSVMATWAAMEYAVNCNIALFDFMGAGKPDEEYGVREFKSKFGGDLVEYGRFRYLCKPILFLIGKLGMQMMKRI